MFVQLICKVFHIISFTFNLLKLIFFNLYINYYYFNLWKTHLFKYSLIRANMQVNTITSHVNSCFTYHINIIKELNLWVRIG